MKQQRYYFLIKNFSKYTIIHSQIMMSTFLVSKVFYVKKKSSKKVNRFNQYQQLQKFLYFYIKMTILTIY